MTVISSAVVFFCFILRVCKNEVGTVTKPMMYRFITSLKNVWIFKRNAIAVHTINASCLCSVCCPTYSASHSRQLSALLHQRGPVSPCLPHVYCFAEIPYLGFLHFISCFHLEWFNFCAVTRITQSLRLEKIQRSHQPTVPTRHDQAPLADSLLNRRRVPRSPLSVLFDLPGSPPWGRRRRGGQGAGPG